MDMFRRRKNPAVGDPTVKSGGGSMDKPSLVPPIALPRTGGGPAELANSGQPPVIEGNSRIISRGPGTDLVPRAGSDVARVEKLPGKSFLTSVSADAEGAAGKVASKGAAETLAKVAGGGVVASAATSLAFPEHTTDGKWVTIDGKQYLMGSTSYEDALRAHNQNYGITSDGLAAGRSLSETDVKVSHGGIASHESETGLPHNQTARNHEWSGGLEPGHDLPVSSSEQAREATAATPSPFGSDENNRGLSAGQNAASPPDVQDARAEAHQPAYSGGAAVEKVDYLKNGATLTTTSTGAEIETTADGHSYTVKHGDHPMATAPELVSEHGDAALSTRQPATSGFSSPVVDSSGLNRPSIQHFQETSSAVDAKLEANANPDLNAGNVGGIAAGHPAEPAFSPPSYETATAKSNDMMTMPPSAQAQDPTPSPTMSPPSYETATAKGNDAMGLTMPTPISAEPTPPPVSGLTSSPDTSTQSSPTSAADAFHHRADML